MGVTSQILDGTGRPNYLKINGEGEAHVVVHSHPPRDEQNATLPFRQYMTDDGTSSGDEDMRVDGSGSPVNFWVNAIPEYDIYIKSLDIVIADAGASLNQFGNIGSLTNGVELCWVSSDLGTTVIHEGLTTNFEFVRLSGGHPAFGSGNSSFKANNVSGNSEAFFMSLDMERIGSNWGLRLRKGTNDKLMFTINDDVQGVDQFDAIAYGVRF